MIDRKVKGKPVIYIPLGQVFEARNGRWYKPVATPRWKTGCYMCAFRDKTLLCCRYRCVADDREDEIGVHFIETEHLSI